MLARGVKMRFEVALTPSCATAVPPGTMARIRVTRVSLAAVNKDFELLAVAPAPCINLEPDSRWSRRVREGAP